MDPDGGKVRVGVVGATGYTGEELLRLLARHPRAHITYVSAKEDRKARIDELFPQLSGLLNLECRSFNAADAIAQCDVIFLSLPHTMSMTVAPQLLRAGKKVIDMSGDYRLQDPSIYETFYKTAHTDVGNLKNAVYGLTEINRAQIKNCQLLSNPGCYPSGATLGLWPGIANGLFSTEDIIIDAKSGVTGTGRKADLGLHYSEVNESIKAYKLFEHQHVPEIDQTLSLATGKKIRVTFVPHLLPVNRGILSTMYVKLNSPIETTQLRELYLSTYNDAPFVQIFPESKLPELKHVTHTNFCAIGLKVDQSRTRAVIVTAIDNLGKGAAGQAVQNFNVMNGFPETEGVL